MVSILRPVSSHRPPHGEKQTYTTGRLEEAVWGMCGCNRRYAESMHLNPSSSSTFSFSTSAAFPFRGRNMQCIKKNHHHYLVMQVTRRNICSCIFPAISDSPSAFPQPPLAHLPIVSIHIPYLAIRSARFEVRNRL